MRDNRQMYNVNWSIISLSYVHASQTCANFSLSPKRPSCTANLFTIGIMSWTFFKHFFYLICKHYIWHQNCRRNVNVNYVLLNWELSVELYSNLNLKVEYVFYNVMANVYYKQIYIKIHVEEHLVSWQNLHKYTAFELLFLVH